MKDRASSRWLVGFLAALMVLQAGCSTMVHDTRVALPTEAKHCEGSEFVTSTHMATLPIPLVAFFTPHVKLNAPDSSTFLNKCGGKQQVNRKVAANYAVCAPTYFLTYLITLGIAGVCPTNVSYEADVVD